MSLHPLEFRTGPLKEVLKIIYLLSCIVSCFLKCRLIDSSKFERFPRGHDRAQKIQKGPFPREILFFSRDSFVHQPLLA